MQYEFLDIFDQVKIFSFYSWFTIPFLPWPCWNLSIGLYQLKQQYIFSFERMNICFWTLKSTALQNKKKLWFKILFLCSWFYFSDILCETLFIHIHKGNWPIISFFKCLCQVLMLWSCQPNKTSWEIFSLSVFSSLVCARLVIFSPLNVLEIIQYWRDLHIEFFLQEDFYYEFNLFNRAIRFSLAFLCQIWKAMFSKDLFFFLPFTYLYSFIVIKLFIIPFLYF